MAPRARNPRPAVHGHGVGPEDHAPEMGPAEVGAQAPAWGAGGCIPDRRRSGLIYLSTDRGVYTKGVPSRSIIRVWDDPNSTTVRMSAMSSVTSLNGTIRMV